MNALDDHREGSSSLVAKLSAEQLDRIDRAIASGTPPTLTECYELFELRERGISFSAFYRYARRYRTGLRALLLARHGVTECDASETIIPRLVGRHMIQVLMTDQFTPRTLQHLAETYRMTSQVEFQRRQIELTEELNVNRIAARAQDDPRLPAPKSDPALASNTHHQLPADAASSPDG